MGDGAAEPYKKLQKAAEDLGVDSRWICEVDQWDGQKKLDDLDHLNGSERETDEDEDVEDPPLEEFRVPLPTERVQILYDESTQWIMKLKKDPSNVQAVEELRNLNAKLEEEAVVKNTEDMMDEGAPTDYWNIEASFFSTHYQMINEGYRQLLEDRQNRTYSEEILEHKRLVDLKIERKHFPASWTMETPEEFLSRRDIASNIDYPWITLKASGGFTIIGYYPVGRGTRALVEREEDGRLIRSYETGSEAGVTADFRSKGLNLSKGQSEETESQLPGKLDQSPSSTTQQLSSLIRM
ncbi:hypothetical protein HRG_013740 [Hirsutella rhossiliensis]|uniref:Uncharacterized protein n=1 Tax=Hirsutella rhossiliensis TaxID=111463 RepID=A0A9P8MUL3_9HYPO|nr:uncharacterized protein HRG_07420 [Hirsutella rhossiliensis]KAH0961342.1 hypothetical protein HRG_07420 [Hirsutella rhossiliensis]